MKRELYLEHLLNIIIAAVSILAVLCLCLTVF